MKTQMTEESDVMKAHLVYAEQMASEHNTRLTPIRKHVYKCLVESETPLGACDILGMLDGMGSPKPPTVYRSLDWLMEIGLVKKIESISKYIAKTSSHNADKTALLVCESCGRAETFDAGPAFDSLGSFAQEKGFQEHQTVIEILGRCSEHKS